MNKYKLTKRKVNKFSGWADQSEEAFSNATSSSNLGGTISGVAGAVGDIANSAIANAEVDTTEADNAIQAARAYRPNKSSLNELSKTYNAANFAKSSYTHNDFMIDTGEALGNMGKAAMSGASAGANIGGPWGAIIGAAAGLIGSGAGWAAGRVKAEKEAVRLNRQAEMANKAIQDNTISARDYILESQNNEFMRNLVAYGGDLNLSGDFNNGLIFVDEGGTHEQNPFEGVLMGVDQEGTPNLVEEGEVIWNDYVFSNRLKPTKKLLKDVGFNEKYKDWTFAKIAEDLQKESSENPNDLISNNTLQDMMNRLITTQEGVRRNKGLIGENRMMANGGNIFNGLKNVTLDNDNQTLLNNALINFGDNKYTDAYKKALTNYYLANQIGNERLKQKYSKRYLKIENKAETLLKDNNNNNSNSNSNNNSNNSNSNNNNSGEYESQSFDWSSINRYAPTILNTGLALSAALQKPDYSRADAIVEAYRDIPTAEFKPIGEKQVYRPIDLNPITNKQINVARATAKDIQNNAITGSQALANLANLNYNTQNVIGETMLTANKEDLNNRLQIAQYNLGIDQANAAGLMQAQQLNQARAEKIGNAIATAGQLKETIDAQRANAIASGLTGVAEDLGSIGRESYEFNQIMSNPEYKDAYLRMLAEKSKTSTTDSESTDTGTTRANGGYLTRKKRRR